MDTQEPEKKETSLNRSQIAKAIFGAGESVGMRDRQVIEKLTAQVIERLEKPQPLPGMEHLIVKSRGSKKKHLPTDAEVQAIVREILAAGSPDNVEEPMKLQKPAKIEEPIKVEEPLKAQEPPKREETRVETIATPRPKGKSTAGISFTKNAIQVLEKRYLKKDKKGQPIETAEDMLRRVSQTIASAELIYNPKADVKARDDEFYDAMACLEFLPNSPTLMNAGRELGQLSACFVLPIEDSMEAIFDEVKHTALFHTSGGGTGFSFSRLRPEKDRVGSTGGVASGPVSFMRVFDTATDVIKQGGMRRGANMAILSVDHPDIMKFIVAKIDRNALTNFNLSVAVTGEFMEAVKAGTDYNLVNPHTKEAEGKLNAREVFDKIVDTAWQTGDPGIVFIDRINRDNPTPQLGRIESTNPCGEQPLLPYESCNLGSINLALMLKGSNGATEIDYPRLARVVKTAVRFLDNVIDVNHFPLPQIEKMTRSTRKIGLGVMGFADMLIRLGIPYDSEEALKAATEVMRFINEEATRTSMELAGEREVFPAFSGSIYDAKGQKIRNATRTTIAPTGTLSIIAGCSSGIEPLFALSFTKNILDGAHLVEVNPYFEEAARNGGFYSEELMKKLADGAHLSEIEGIPDKVKRVFVTAHEITPEWHVRMQAAFQKSTDNAVSKTVNFPKDATREDIAKVYTLAYEQGLKGITIYRDRSRDDQVLTTGKAGGEKTEKAEAAAQRTPRKRAKVTHGVTERVTTGCGYLYVTVNSDGQGICEVFSSLGKAGGCASAQLEANCRLISLALRSGVDVASVVKQLRGIRCPSIAWEEGKSILSCADAIGVVLEKHIPGSGDGSKPKPKLEDYGLARNLAGQCPDCGNILAYQEGCFKCPACGYTKC
ncbi:MAG: vitamin B12-dependent ribonucleotide reductase [Dehalococcoidales bacterium]|nr:vitamin B12-dependent ribonucleotide reductase [Dehalococcoidales bacterium]